MRIGFIGTGNMASAIMGGILSHNLAKPEEIYGADVFAPSREKVEKQFGIHTTDNNLEVVKNTDIVFLSVKPPYYQEVITQIASEICDEQIVITIAPGKTLSWLADQFGKQVKIVRLMPNTPAMVGTGMTATCPNEYITEKKRTPF